MWSGRRDPDGRDVMDLFLLLFGWIANGLEDDDPNARAEIDPDG